jgi:hypothetical protein
VLNCDWDIHKRILRALHLDVSARTSPCYRGDTLCVSSSKIFFTEMAPSRQAKRYATERHARRNAKVPPPHQVPRRIWSVGVRQQMPMHVLRVPRHQCVTLNIGSMYPGPYRQLLMFGEWNIQPASDLKLGLPPSYNDVPQATIRIKSPVSAGAMDRPQCPIGLLQDMFFYLTATMSTHSNPTGVRPIIGSLYRPYTRPHAPTVYWRADHPSPWIHMASTRNLQGIH